ncbi:MAG: hypothetical protein MUE88_07575 [Flavobacteriales bacterium]|nr:hypothetical protein [Flavobacteriales bacterium]
MILGARVGRKGLVDQAREELQGQHQTLGRYRLLALDHSKALPVMLMPPAFLTMNERDTCWNRSTANSA